MRDNFILSIVLSYNEMLIIMYFLSRYIRLMDVETIIVDLIVVRRMNKNAKILTLYKQLYIPSQHYSQHLKSFSKGVFF